MISVKVCPRGHSESVPVPERPHIICSVQPKRISMFAQTVQTRIVGQAGTKPDVLGLEDQRFSTAVEKHRAILTTADRESEGGFGVSKVEQRRRSTRAIVGRPREDGLGHLIHLLSCVLNYNMEAVVFGRYCQQGRNGTVE